MSGPNVPAVPARVSTPADLDALPVGSVVLSGGDVWRRLPGGWDCLSEDGEAGLYATETVWHAALPASVTLLHVPGRDLLAEAEARGYERGKRDALTEAAEAAEVRWPGLITFRNWLRARAAETPDGGA